MGWVGFGGLSLLAGSTWLLGGYAAPTWPDLLRVCFHDGIVFLVLLAVGGFRKMPFPRRVVGGLVGWGAVLFAVPTLVSAGAGGHLGSLTEMLVFGLVPFLTVFVMAQRVGGDLRLLVPAVVGVGGLALVVPFAWPSSNVGVGWLVGMAIAAGFVAVAGIRMHGLMRGASTVWAGALGSGAAALLAGAAWWVMERGPVDFGWRVVAMEVGWSLVVDLPLVLLTIWLVREMRPVGFAARFLSVPLVTILGGLGVMRPVVVWTTWLGLALVAGGCWVLLRNQADVEVTGPLR